MTSLMSGRYNKKVSCQVLYNSSFRTLSTRDRFHGRPFFHRQKGWGWVEGWWKGGAGNNDEALLAHLQLCGPVPNRQRTSPGPRLWGWGPLLYETPYYQSVCNVEGVINMKVNTCLAITWRLSMKPLETLGSGCMGVQRRHQVKSEMRVFTHKKLHFMFRVSYLSLLSYTFSPFSKNYKLQEVMDHICVETV